MSSNGKALIDLKKTFTNKAMGCVKDQPKILVGMMDRQTEVRGCLNGSFSGEPFGPVSGGFSVKADSDLVAAKRILIESLKRITLAIRAGESTSFFSGGEPFSSSVSDNDASVEKSD